VALQSGLVVSLGDWKRNALCAQLQIWEQTKVRVPRMSTRISTLELQQHDVFEKVRHTMKQYGLSPQSLGVEISERALVEGGDGLAPTLSQLKALGVEITLGDFGANFTNLALLRSLPVDVIKIDRSCVPDVTAAVGAVSLTRAIINMGHSLQMQVMAEGVETTGQLTLLIASGCDRMQGPVLASPVNGETFIQMLSQRKRLPDSMLSRRR
jgi:EAL domain-containing protein (putative c-di-GMP-specific phosphodiesterase class I)